jgi:type I restriction enzyme S subunit
VWNPGDDVSTFKRVLPDDFVIGLRSFQHGIAHSKVCGLVSPAYTVLRAHEGVETGYYRHLFRSDVFVSLLANRSSGIRQGKTIDYSAFGQIPCPVPPIPDQRSITKLLDRETTRIDDLIEQKQTLANRLSERLNAYTARLLEPSKGTPKIRLGRFTREITDGPFGSKLTSDHYAVEGARVIRLGNIGLAKFIDSDKAFISLDYFYELRAHEAKPGDLVIAGLGGGAQPLGRACVVPDHLGAAIVKADCFRVRLDQSRLLHDYVAWFLSTAPGIQQNETYTRGATRGRFNTSVARELMVPMPPLTEQREVVRRCEAVREQSEAATSRLGTQIELLGERRQALITAAVTGAIQVGEEE